MSLAEVAELTSSKPSFFSMKIFSGRLSALLWAQETLQQFCKGLRSTSSRRMCFFQIPGREGSCNPFKSYKQLLASLAGSQGCLSSRWLHLRNLSILTGKRHRKFRVSLPGKWTYHFCLPEKSTVKGIFHKPCALLLSQWMSGNFTSLWTQN